MKEQELDQADVLARISTFEAEALKLTNQLRQIGATVPAAPVLTTGEETDILANMKTLEGHVIQLRQMVKTTPEPTATAAPTSPQANAASSVDAAAIAKLEESVRQLTAQLAAQQPNGPTDYTALAQAEKAKQGTAEPVYVTKADGSIDYDASVKATKSEARAPIWILEADGRTIDYTASAEATRTGLVPEGAKVQKAEAEKLEFVHNGSIRLVQDKIQPHQPRAAWKL